MNNNEIIKRIESDINENNIQASVEPHRSNIPIIIDVHVNGDWKHDHIAVKNIMRKYNCSILSEEMIGDNDDDSYESIHHYIINTADCS